MPRNWCWPKAATNLPITVPFLIVTVGAWSLVALLDWRSSSDNGELRLTAVNEARRMEDTNMINDAEVDICKGAEKRKK